MVRLWPMLSNPFILRKGTVHPTQDLVPSQPPTGRIVLCAPQSPADSEQLAWELGIVAGWPCGRASVILSLSWSWRKLENASSFRSLSAPSQARQLQSIQIDDYKSGRPLLWRRCSSEQSPEGISSRCPTSWWFFASTSSIYHADLRERE